MATGTMENKKMGRPAKSQRDDVSVKFDRKLAGKARQIAHGRGIPMAEYLSELAREIVDRDYKSYVKELDI